jgi:flagellar L-ring protein precursor FlgH
MINLTLCLLIVTLLCGCNTTEYATRIRNEPFNIDSTFKHVQQQQVRKQNKTGTVWPGESNTNNFFSDNRASRVGDVITIKIAEASKANEAATTDLKRTGANVNLGVPNFFGLETNKFPSSINPASMVSTTVKNDFKGEGETTRNGAFTATLAAKVVEVMPNGNLAVEGKREISVNNERKEMLFQGIVRPKDIAADNSVFSTQVADAKVIMTGIGVVGEKQSPGWLARIFDIVWPF